MQSKQRSSCNRHPKPNSSLAYSSASSDSPALGYSISTNWPNEWAGVYHESGSSDFLSQSVASSTSWTDELESGLTASLETQYRLIEHTLYHDGEQELPTHSPLREECRLWQQQFPHLRVFGQAVKPSVGCQTRSRQEEIEEQLEEIIASHGEYNENDSNKVPAKTDIVVDSSEIYKEKIKKAVIDQIFLRIWPEVVKKIEPLLCKAATSQKDVFSVSPELKLKCDDSLSENLTSGFNSLTLIEDLSLRPKSGRRSGVASRRNMSAVVPVKPIVLECSIPVPVPIARTSSALRRSPGRLSYPAKHPSPERLLSPLPPPLPLEPPTPAPARSATGRRLSRPRPQYDARTGRMINRDDARRNLKTSPPVPWSRHVTLPPIESTEIVPKTMEPRGKRSTSALFKGGRLNSGSRPNTSLTAKFSQNHVVLGPLDSLQIKQTAVTTSRPWPAHHNYVSCEAVQLRQADQRQRWRNRTNTVKRY